MYIENVERFEKKILEIECVADHKEQKIIGTVTVNGNQTVDVVGNSYDVAWTIPSENITKLRVV